ncbi:ATP-grasp domain-containing protein [Planctomicrobium sp. SH527]|uniref:ATP-grasp domain-containing protein n=1 Tax=Planctomicrobium sp. SH527 TaxID=3448123 RepID=UPI003F5C48D9
MPHAFDREIRWSIELILPAEPVADLIIVGASSRAAAFSAIRSGFRPICLDQFADADLQANATVLPWAEDDSGILEQIQRCPGIPVMYVGGMENRPALIEAIAQTHAVWGNSADVVRRIRNPAELTEPARLSRISLPEWRDETQPPPGDGTWILRPRAGAGGRGIQVWDDAARASETLQEPHFFQKRIEGVPFSATFIAPAEVGDVRFVGMTRQLIGEEFCFARPFQWCGNIGPVALPISTELTIRRFGNVLKWKLGLRGFFGVDLIIDEDGTPWVTEVNPRYPASSEILEHITGIPLLQDHCRCFTEDPLPETDWDLAHPGELLGKAIVYAPQDLVLSEEIVDAASVPVMNVPDITDLPTPGTHVRSGEPVCTVFAEASTSEILLDLLKQRIAEIVARLKSDY